MRSKNLFISLLFILILVFSSVTFASQIKSTASGELRIISSNTNLKVGDLGFIRIQGKANTRYNIYTSFNRGGTAIRVKQSRITDSNGQTTFNWVVENGTTPGVNTATITGGGESITVTHTVIQ